MSKPKLIGVTGGIGSGKSTVCKIFEVLGHQTYYADDRAKFLMNYDETLKQEIKSLFGEVAYENGLLNRQELSHQVFQNENLLKQLNQVVHPAVGRDFVGWVDAHSDQVLLLKEAALLFETGSYKDLDATILVVADKETRIKRVTARDPQRSAQEVSDIIDKQLSDDQKTPLADFVIHNTGETSLIEQVMDVHQRLI